MASHLDLRKVELTALLDEMAPRAMICAPRELALARANLEFSLYESDAGRTMRAARHLQTAQTYSKEAWERSRGDECEGDIDLDGIRDSKDKCPKEPEDYDGVEDEDGCPDYDKDGDGIQDNVDKCPEVPEDFDDFEDEDGCPELDNDRDEVPDAVDQCPNDPEDRDGFQDIDGCPDPDNDADGLLDPEDKCPNEPEDFDGDRDDDGCPEEDEYKTIVVTKTRIELKQKIYFKTARARILARSYGLLNEVVDALGDRKDLKVRIEGHTDSRGTLARNQKLSERRANSVKNYLTEAGVDPHRLQAVGFGEEIPVDTNANRAGRARNRRVEFHIVE